MSGGSILDYEPDLRNELKTLLITFKSRMNEQLLAQGSDLTEQQSAVGKAFEALESWLWKWNWDLRGNYVRSGKIQLEDGGTSKEFPSHAAQAEVLESLLIYLPRND